jgi:hypothetical protein
MVGSGPHRLPWWELTETAILINSCFYALLLFGWWLLFERRRRLIARRVWRSNLATCGWCGQPLHGSHNPISCHACGTRHDRADLRAAWLRHCPAHWRIEGQDL